MSLLNCPKPGRYEFWQLVTQDMPHKLSARDVCAILRISYDELVFRVDEGTLPEPVIVNECPQWRLGLLTNRPDKASAAGYVYFIESGDFIKIGFTIEVISRIKKIAGSTPYDVKFLKAIQGTLATEREYHRKFSALQHHGEWFRDDPSLRKFIKNLRVAYQPGEGTCPFQ